jgi:hypothetical protein
MNAKRGDSDVLSLMHTYEPPPRDFDALRASPRELLKYGLPRRPNPETEPLHARLWERHFAVPIEWVQADLSIDKVLSRRDPLRRSGLPKESGPMDFGPSGWGGAVVTTASLGLNPPEAANNVFATWVVPGIFPASDPNQDLTVGFWVGLDGWTNGQVLQAGIALTITKDFKFLWWAWTEWYTTQFKDPAVRVDNFDVHPGDTISVLVCAPQPDHGFVSLHNDTTHQATSVGIDARPGITSAGQSAEWIIEGISPELPVFFPVTFGSCAAGTKNHAFNAKPSGVTTNIAGTSGPLTDASIVSPQTVVVDWEAWS